MSFYFALIVTITFNLFTAIFFICSYLSISVYSDLSFYKQLLSLADVTSMVSSEDQTHYSRDALQDKLVFHYILYLAKKLTICCYVALGVFSFDFVKKKHFYCIMAAVISNSIF